MSEELYARQHATYRVAHESIILAAKKLIAQAGFRAMNVIDLAAEAEVSRATLYNHFRDKDAIGIGKSISYVAYQTSNVTNSAAIMGSFTSLLIGNTVNTWISTISTYANTINASVSLSTGISNLSLSTVTTIDTNLAEINSTIYTRRVHDENYFTNAKTVMNEVTELRSYSARGSTEDYLLQNINGTEKLLTRINA